jgi:hypothetical protein
MGLGSFLPVLKAYWAGQPETWLPALSVSLPIQLSVTSFRFPKGIHPGLLYWAIRACIGSRLLPLLVTPTFLLFGKVTTLFSSRCPCGGRTALRAIPSEMANLMTGVTLTHLYIATPRAAHCIYHGMFGRPARSGASAAP